jgi:hypothetical protein
MARQRRNPKSIEVRREGPVKPGSPLYRLLQCIAREVAKELQNGSATSKSPPKS